MGGSVSLSDTQSLDMAKNLQLAYENLKADGRSDEELQLEMRDRYLRMLSEMKAQQTESRAEGVNEEINGNLEESSTLSYFSQVDKIERAKARPVPTPKVTSSPAVSEKTRSNMLKTGRKLTAKVIDQGCFVLSDND